MRDCGMVKLQSPHTTGEKLLDILYYSKILIRHSIFQMRHKMLLSNYFIIANASKMPLDKIKISAILAININIYS